MTYFSYHHTRTRSRSRSRERTSQPLLIRRSSFKRQRLFSSSDDDDDYDDYPYSGNHRPSRVLIRHEQPSQLERWNIWSDTRKEESCNYSTEDNDRGRRRRRRVSFADEVNEDEERTFRLRIATLSRDRLRRVSPPPRRHQTESDDERIRMGVWSGDPSRRRERCVSEEYEAREKTRSRSRSRERRYRDGVWCDDESDRETEAERWVRWRRIKRTKTEEWRPLAGWRRV